MSGTFNGKDGLSDNEKLNEPSMEEIADAIQRGDHLGIDRLMGSASSPEEKDTEENDEGTAEEPVSAEANPDGGEEPEAEPSDAEEGEDEPEKVEASEPEAATPAASPVVPAEHETEIEELRKELHRYKSDAGRVPHMQRRMAELERELRATKARTPDNPNSGKPNSVDVNSVELDDETKAQIEALREIDPVYAKTVERVAKAAIAASTAKFQNSFDTYVSEEQRAEDERFYMEQKTILGQMIPQHEQVFATPEWQQWKATLSPGRRAMAESAYADEVAQAIYAFAADMQRLQGGVSQQQAPAQAAPAQPASSPTPSVEESEVHKARQAKVAKAAAVPSAAAKKDATLDENAYFEQVYNDLARANHLIK